MNVSGSNISPAFNVMPGLPGVELKRMSPLLSNRGTIPLMRFQDP
jgi:hypothetical protein